MNLLVAGLKKNWTFDNIKCSVIYIPVNYTQALEERISVVLSPGLYTVFGIHFFTASKQPMPKCPTVTQLGKVRIFNHYAMFNGCPLH